MNPDVLMMTALTVMWAALVVLTWIVWRLHTARALRRAADRIDPGSYQQGWADACELLAQKYDQAAAETYAGEPTAAIYRVAARVARATDPAVTEARRLDAVGEEQTWAAVADVLDCCTDMERTPA